MGRFLRFTHFSDAAQDASFDAAASGHMPSCRKMCEGMRSAGMVGILFVYLRSDGASAQPSLHACRVFRTDSSHQRKRLNERRLRVVGVVAIDLFHGGGVRLVASGLVALAVQYPDSQ